MLRLADLIDGVNRRIGHSVAWMALGLVLVEVAVVILRYVFSIGLIQLQEAAVYQHGFLITLGVGYTLLQRGHVRVDIIYGRLRERGRSAVDLFGALFFVLPLAWLIFEYSWPYVAQSWRIMEGSREASGLPFLYVLKSGILGFAILLGLQAISLAIHSVYQLLAPDERLQADG